MPFSIVAPFVIFLPREHVRATTYGAHVFLSSSLSHNPQCPPPPNVFCSPSSHLRESFPSEPYKVDINFLTFAESARYAR